MICTKFCAIYTTSKFACFQATGIPKLQEVNFESDKTQLLTVSQLFSLLYNAQLENRK